MEKIQINELTVSAYVPRLGIGNDLSLDIDPYLVNLLQLYAKSPHIKDVTVFPNHQFRRVNNKPVMKGLLVETDNVIMPSLLGPKFGNGVLLAEIPWNNSVTLSNKNIEEIKDKALREMNFDLGGIPPQVRHMQYLVDEFYTAIKEYAKESHLIISNKYLLEKSFKESIGHGHHFVEIRKAPVSNKLFLIIHGGASAFSAMLFVYYQNKAEEFSSVDETGNININTDLGKKYIADLQIAMILAKFLRRQQANFMRSILCQVFKESLTLNKIFDQSYTGISSRPQKSGRKNLLHYNGAYRIHSFDTPFVFISDILRESLIVKPEEKHWDKIDFIPAYSGNKHELPKTTKFLSTVIDLNKKGVIHNMMEAKGQEHCATEYFQDPYLWLSLFPRVSYSRLFPLLNLRSTQCS